MTKSEKQAKFVMELYNNKGRCCSDTRTILNEKTVECGDKEFDAWCEEYCPISVKGDSDCPMDTAYKRALRYMKKHSVDFLEELL